MGDGYSTGNGVCANDLELERIHQIMSLFPGVRYQLGASIPWGIGKFAIRGIVTQLLFLRQQRNSFAAPILWIESKMQSVKAP